MTARPRVVIAGLGDTGLLVALHLAKHADVVGISSKPGLVSGQELGLRLAKPEEWRRDYWIGFERFRGLDRVRTVHGSVVGLDPVARRVQVRGADGSDSQEEYDALVVATGVTNGFWRSAALQDEGDIAQSLAGAHAELAEAARVAVVGGGAAAVSTAWNIRDAWPDKQVDLYFPGEQALAQHHPRVWAKLSERMARRGIGLHAGHRAVLPDDLARIGTGSITWSTGQAATTADAIVWAVGRVCANTDWLPPSLLDEHGFVIVDEHLRVPGAAGVYAIGDVAATDPLRSSARARADHLLARNLRADLGGGRLKRFQPLRRRWGSVVGPQGDRLEVFSPGGTPYVIPAWRTLQPWLVRRAIYGGVRAE